MLQNRVDPSGQLIRTAARGAWMGNRGLLHDEHRQIVRPYRLKAWLICVLEFKGRRRTVMTPNRYTELFFLDEATAFSAGHRPCFECRREAANHFRRCWVKGNPSFGFTEKTPIDQIDAVLHRERTGLAGPYVAGVGKLPNGVFVWYEDAAHLVVDGSLFPWSPFGYGERGGDAERVGHVGRVGFGEPVKSAKDVELRVITPRSTVNAFRMGYVPQMGYF